MSSSEKLSANTSTNDSSFLDGVLIIRYADLSPDPLIRLEVVAAIGRLLDAPGQSQPLSSLVSSPTSAQALLIWLSSDEASRFWSVKDDVIISHRRCEKHVLVGTRHLLRDLNTLASTPRPPRLTDLDTAWQAAAHLIEQTHID